MTYYCSNRALYYAVYFLWVLAWLLRIILKLEYPTKFIRLDYVPGDINPDTAALAKTPFQFNLPIYTQSGDSVALESRDLSLDLQTPSNRLLKTQNVKRIIRLREPELAFLRRHSPIGGIKNSLAVSMNPGASLPQVIDLDLNDGPIGTGSDIEEEVAVLADHVDEVVHDRSGVHVFLVGRGAVVPVAEGVHPLVALPLATLRRAEGRVFRGVEVGGPRRSAPVIDGDLAALRARPVEPPRCEAVRPVRRPRVAPHDVGLVPVGEQIHLRHHEVRDEVVDGDAARVRLLEPRVGVARYDARMGRRCHAVELREPVLSPVWVEPLGQREVGASPEMWLVCGCGVE